MYECYTVLLNFLCWFEVQNFNNYLILDALHIQEIVFCICLSFNLDIFLLPAEDCYSVSSTYKGRMTCTRYGVPCQRWDVNTPHMVTYRSSDPDDLASNYCRNHGGNSTPWCYTTDPGLEWKYCPIAKCWKHAKNRNKITIWI
jgi:hypothetical protein